MRMRMQTTESAAWLELCALVGVVDVESCVVHELGDGCDVAGHIGPSLETQPLEHHEALQRSTNMQ